jgi:hypothetical protein
MSATSVIFKIAVQSKQSPLKLPLNRFAQSGHPGFKSLSHAFSRKIGHTKEQQKNYEIIVQIIIYADRQN